MRPLSVGGSITAGLVLLLWIAPPAVTARANAGRATAPVRAKLPLNTIRRAASDLEVGGELAGLAAGLTRYVAQDSLLALSLATYTVADDSNFVGATKISGVPLEELVRMLGAAPESDMVVAICDDKYRANYPRAYMAAHHPLLVLRVNGEPPVRWPKDPETRRLDMGPYMISHPRFAPSFKVLAHSDEAQIPGGVVRIEFRNEKAVLGAIAPRGARAEQASVQAGYRIAQQNCFRCHNAGREGGEKSGRPWLVLAAWAAASPDFFEDYVRDPKKRNEHTQMPGNPGYDRQTTGALRHYFATFITTTASSSTSAGKP
jgi:mono/diheme cytochrome c family protein